MKRNFLTIFLLLLFTVSTALQAQDLSRDDVDAKYKWNLTHLYTSLDDWKADKEAINEHIEKLAAYQGKLGESAETLEAALDLQFDTLKKLYVFYSYASMLSDQDVSVSANQELVQEAQSIWTSFAEAASFVDPEILEIPTATIEEYIAANEGLQEYKLYLEDIQRLKDHTLSDQGEKILASFGLPTAHFADAYNIFGDTEMPNAEVTLKDGETVKLTPASYTRHRSTKVREDRSKIFEAFFNNYGTFKNTIGSMYAGKVKNDFTMAKNRNYETALERALDANNIPVDVYTNLIEQIHNSLPTLHRFLDLKKRMLGVDELHYYDLYAPIVEKVELAYELEEGQDVLIASLEPLGENYQEVVEKAFNENWIDYYPTSNKRSGAYSNGSAYDVHPYILMNWNDDYNSLSTLTHEIGHTMHSYFSNTNQTFANSDYSIFVAEIASTFNEALLNDYLVERAETDEEKLFLLGNYLELLRQTIFRQVSFAEFELLVHQEVEAGRPVTGEKMSEIYGDIVQTYYGHEKGHCVVDPYVSHEWAYIPHFINYTYYVYQYASSLIYATALAQKALEEGQPAVDDYYKLLKGGASKYPIDLIRDAGIDPLSSEPFELTMARMNTVMDQIEEILDRQ